MPRPAASRALTIFAALMLSLCAGAVWSVAALLFGDLAQWFAFVAAAVAVWAVDWMALRHGAARAIVAAVLTALAAAYAFFLHAASVISIKLGIPFADALRSIGAEMAWALSVARAPTTQGWLIVIGVLAAAIIAARRMPGPVAR